MERRAASVAYVQSSGITRKPMPRGCKSNDYQVDDSMNMDGPRSLDPAELSFCRGRAQTLQTRSGRMLSAAEGFEEMDASQLRRLKHVVDTGNASRNSLAGEQVASPTALQDILAVKRTSSRVLKDRLAPIIEEDATQSIKD
mmetsp:Transcript_4841/g.10339  ORF Transcript_4841/g.10339 Transcript_4841/m.10339 type:complete len:142 (-) Transcript_4841:191-616(-)